VAGVGLTEGRWARCSAGLGTRREGRVLNPGPPLPGSEDPGNTADLKVRPTVADIADVRPTVANTADLKVRPTVANTADL